MSFVVTSTGEHRHSVLKQVMSASFQILTYPSFMIIFRPQSMIYNICSCSKRKNQLIQ